MGVQRSLKARLINLRRNDVSYSGKPFFLQILHGAKREGFKTSIVVNKEREGFYKRFGFIDDFQAYKNEDEAIELINRNPDSVFIPHGSLIEYMGMDRVSKIKTPIFGNRKLFPWESNQSKKNEIIRVE